MVLDRIVFLWRFLYLGAFTTDTLITPLRVHDISVRVLDGLFNVLDVARELVAFLLVEVTVE